MSRNRSVLLALGLALSPLVSPAARADDGARLIAAAQRQDVAAVRELQILITKSRAEDPARSAEMPEDARAAYVLEYQKMMLDFGMKVMELEAALLEGDNEAAQTVWKDVNGMKGSTYV